MRSWIGCSIFSIRYPEIYALLTLLLFFSQVALGSCGNCPGNKDEYSLRQVLTVESLSLNNYGPLRLHSKSGDLIQYRTLNYALRDTVPEPRSVMRQSMIIPGWGQITNEQAWKVPIVYTLFAGVAAYTVYSNRMYQGYRAAYYNSFAENTDERFGPTPSFIPAEQPAEVYRQNRNQFRNRRDLSFVGFLLVYGLNIADAYVFAQLRDFDVSDDLSMQIDFGPQTHPTGQHAAVTVRFGF